jgi:hypothetical protein
VWRDGALHVVRDFLEGKGDRGDENDAVDE